MVIFLTTRFLLNMVLGANTYLSATTKPDVASTGGLGIPQLKKL